LIDMRRVVKSIRPSHIVKKLADEPDNRFPECAETARADFLITGNTALSPGVEGDDHPRAKGVC
jgi:predicted nucleic acid-binding protein